MQFDIDKAHDFINFDGDEFFAELDFIILN